MSSDREAIEQASACAFRIAIDQWAVVGDMRVHPEVVSGV